MKKIILVISFVAVAFGMATMPTDKSDTYRYITDVAKATAKQTFESNVAWCPVIGYSGSIPLPSQNNLTEQEGVVIYEHCDSCRTGAILPHKDGTLCCTFCGKIVTNKE